MRAETLVNLLTVYFLHGEHGAGALDLRFCPTKADVTPNLRHACESLHLYNILISDATVMLRSGLGANSEPNA